MRAGYYFQFHSKNYFSKDPVKKANLENVRYQSRLMIY